MEKIYKNQFDILFHKKRFLLKLGNYISHQVISHFNGKELIFKTEKELNDLNREELASDFYWNFCPSVLFEGMMDRDFLIDEIALYIDKRIPQSYLKYKYELHDTSPSKVNPNDYEHNLIYHYQQNKK